jgi:hypothetical protein
MKARLLLCVGSGALLVVASKTSVALAQTNAQQSLPVELSNFVNSPLAKIIFGGSFLAMLVAISALAWGLFKYGKDIKKLNEFETMSRLSSLARTMGDNTNAYGKLSQRLDIASTEVDDTKQRLATLLNKLNALEALIEGQTTTAKEPILSSTSPQGQTALNDAMDIENWEIIRAGWRDVRDGIEAAIELIDGRTRKKYSDAPRYNYTEIIEFLRSDSVLGVNGALDAQNMNRLFLRNRPRKARIDPGDVRRFVEWKATVLAELGRFAQIQKWPKPRPSSELQPTQIEIVSEPPRAPT